MKRLTLIFVTLLLCSCEIQYNTSTRLVIEGKVIDRYGTPIENNSIEVWVYNSHDSDFIGYSNTNSNGDFEIIIPEPTNENSFTVKIKGDSNYREIEYNNIWQSDFIDYSFNIGNITSIQNNDISDLEITLNQINPENNITNIELTGLIADHTILVNPVENDYPNQYYYNNYFKQVAKNQTLNLYYEVLNGSTGEIDSFNELIDVESNAVTEYNISY